jgi:hypothetical protein
MATLTYWVAECLNDNQCYSLIGKTRKAVQAELNTIYGAYHKDETPEWQRTKYGPIEKKEIIYKDAFDLFDWATGEGGGRYHAGLTPKD